MPTFNNPATEDLNLNGFRARHGATSLNDDDYVRRDELEAIANSRNDVRYLKRSPTGVGDAMQADLPFGGHKAVGLADGTVATDGATFGQMTSADTATLNEAKAYTDAHVSAVVGLPRHKDTYPTSATDHIWHNPSATESITVYLLLKGAGGGAAGFGSPGSGKGGGKGAVLMTAVVVPGGGTLTIRVGGGGGGGNFTGSFYQHGGGGGGSGTRIIVKDSSGGILTTLVAGGGGGGGGTRDGASPDCAGGAGGMPGEPVGGVGGIAGVGGVTEQAGLGGAGGYSAPNGGIGGNGTTSATVDQGMDYLFDLSDRTPANGGVYAATGRTGQDGFAIVRW